MTKKRWDGATFTDLTTKKRWDGATWVDLTVGKKWDGAAWVDIAGFGGGGGGFSVTVSPGSVSGFEYAATPLFRTVTSDPTTATPSGGTGPYTYAWTRISGQSSISATAPTAATTSFAALVARDNTIGGIWRVTVTDSLSATATADVDVTLMYIDSGGL